MQYYQRLMKNNKELDSYELHDNPYLLALQLQFCHGKLICSTYSTTT